MTDVGTEFLRGISAFGASRLGQASETTLKDAGSLIASLGDSTPNSTKDAFNQLKADFEADAELAKPIEKQLQLIAKMAKDSIADAKAGSFTTAEAGRIAVRIGTALIAIEEAVEILAKKLATEEDDTDTVNEVLREELMEVWDPWVQPFKNLAGDAGKLLDSLGDEVLGIPHATQSLGDVLSFDREKFRLAAQLASTEEKNFGALRLNQTKLEAFLGFARREFKNPSEQQKLDLVEGEKGKWWYADEAVFGLRIYTVVRPGLQKDPLLKKVMPGAKDPKTVKPTAITLDSVEGLYLGDGQGAANERLTLPVQFNFPAVEIREIALGIVRDKTSKEMTGLELTSVIAAELGDVVGMQVVGAGVTIALDGQPPDAAVFPWDVSPRWPEAVGLRIEAGPVNGHGYIERKVRTYGSGKDAQELVEFGGELQLEVAKVGVYAICLLSPEPFSLVLVMGVRFPTPINLVFGFTLNGVGGLLALDRRVDSNELIKGMQTHFIDHVLFPDDPKAEAPKILDQVAHVFPPQQGGFVVGPIVELGWGSQAKIVEAKLGIVLALPDPKLILLGAVRIRAPTKTKPLTDFRCEVYGEVTSDRLLIIATLRDSKIAKIAVSGDMGLLIQWGGHGAFALSVGGFHPRYDEAPAELKGLERLTIDLSPPKVVTIVVKAYFAVTAGAVMAGVRGDLKADVGIARAHAWLQLDMIFRWVPRFGFAVDIAVGIEIDVFGCSFASISFRGSLEGTTPWKVEGKATVDVWWAPTFHLNLGPYTWGDSPPAIAAVESLLSIAQEAMNEKEAWKAVMPDNGDLLAGLGRVEAEGLVAHPLAALEITQSRLPLETHIDRIGSAAVDANRVSMGLATTSAGPAGAVSTVKAPFAPGQFLALEGEALLARSGFDALTSGCRVGAATTPVAGPAKRGEVRWHTYFRDEDAEPVEAKFDSRMFASVIVDQSLIARGSAARDNPYLPRTEKPKPAPGAVSVLPAGSATVNLADDGSAVLADLGVLSASEAGRVADAINASGAGDVAAVAVGAI